MIFKKSIQDLMNEKDKIIENLKLENEEQKRLILKLSAENRKLKNISINEQNITESKEKNVWMH
jgi:hypothetical protein